MLRNHYSFEQRAGEQLSGSWQLFGAVLSSDCKGQHGGGDRETHGCLEKPLSQ